MGERRKSREFALQVMYAIDLAKISPMEALRLFWHSNSANSEISQEVVAFTEGLVGGTIAKLTDIDSIIGSHSVNWKVSRMSVVDRNILRLAVYELCWCPDIPVRVTLNEAIEIAKQYGTEESGSFINGILDKVAKEIDKE